MAVSPFADVTHIDLCFSQSDDDDDDDDDSDDDVKSIDDDYIALVSLDCLRFSLRSSSFAFSSDA